MSDLVEVIHGPTPVVEVLSPTVAVVEVIQQGPRGPAGPSLFGASGSEFHQAVPAATWVFPYSGRTPTVAIYIDGQLVDADVTVAGGNVTVQFPVPVSGILVLG